MKLINLEEANKIIQETCDNYGINTIQYSENDLVTCSERGEWDVACFHVEVKMNLAMSEENYTTVATLSFPLRVRSMPNHMTPEEMKQFGDKCYAVAKCVEDLIEEFKDKAVMWEK